MRNCEVAAAILYLKRHEIWDPGKPADAVFHFFSRTFQKPHWRRYETPPEPIVSDSPLFILLRPGANPETKDITTRHSSRGRSASSARIPRTAVTGRNAETDEQEDCRTGRDLPYLPRRVHGLQRHRARPQESERHGRSLERRSPGQYPGNTLVVQRRKRINETE